MEELRDYTFGLPFGRVQRTSPEARRGSPSTPASRSSGEDKQSLSCNFDRVQEDTLAAAWEGEGPICRVGRAPLTVSRRGKQPPHSRTLRLHPHRLWQRRVCRGDEVWYHRGGNAIFREQLHDMQLAHESVAVAPTCLSPSFAFRVAGRVLRAAWHL